MPQAAPVWTGPSGGAWTYRFKGTRSRSPALTGDEKVLFSADQSDGQGALFCVDLRTRHLVWTRIVPAPFSTSPTVSGNTVFIGNEDHHLYAIDVASGEVLWRFDAGAPIDSQPVFFSGSSLCFGTTAGTYWAVTHDAAANQGRLRWRIASPYGSATGARTSRAAASFGSVVYAVSHGGSSRFNIVGRDSTQVMRSYPFDAEVTTEPAVVDTVAWFVLADGRFVRIEIARALSLPVPRSLNAPVTGALASSATAIYATTSDGRFFGQPIASGAAWQIPVTHSIPTGVVVHGGDAYFAGRDPTGKGDFYTLDLVAAAEQNAQTPIESLHGIVTSPPALQNGVVAFTAFGEESGTLYAFHSDDTVMLARVKFSSRLIVGDYDVSGEKETPKRPEYQSVITVTDGNNIAQAGVRVALWASIDGTAVIAPNGKVNLRVPELAPHYEITNASGQIPLTLWRDPNKDPLFPGTASLFVRPDFFVSEYALQVFPDQETMTHLSGVQSDGLEAAEGYDRGKVIKDSYRTDASKRDSIALTIRNLMGAQENVSSNRLTKSPAQALSASAAAGTTTSAALRGIAPGEHPHWTLDLEGDNAAFVPRTADEIDGIRAAAMKASGIGSGFRHFVDHVTHGEAKVTSMTWKHVEQGAERFAHMTAHAGELFYDFAVKSVDEAVQVLRGVIKDIITSIERFVEWLSWLFDWNDILATKSHFKDVTLKALDEFRDALNDDRTKAALHDQLVELRQNAAASFASMIHQLTGTVSSAQQSAPSKQEVLAPHGVDITGQAGWLLRKLPAADDIGFDPDPADMAALVAAWERFYITAQSTAETDFVALADRLAASMDAFFRLFDGTADGLLKQAVAAVIEVFEDVVETLFDFLIAILDDLLELLATTVEILKRILTTPIHAGFVSRLYRAISGSDLELLDLAALVVAVPATIMFKLMESATRATSKEMTGPTALDLTGAALGFVYYGVMAMEEVTEKTNVRKLAFLNLGQGVLNVLVTALSMNGMFNDRKSSEYPANVFYFVCQMPSTVFNCVVFGIRNDKEARAEWDKAEMPSWTVLGVVNAALAVIYAFLFPKDYLDPGGTSLLGNLFTSLPYFSSLAVKKEQERAALFLTGFGYWVGGSGMSIAQAIAEGPDSGG